MLNRRLLKARINRKVDIRARFWRRFIIRQTFQNASLCVLHEAINTRRAAQPVISLLFHTQATNAHGRVFVDPFDPVDLFPVLFRIEILYRLINLALVRARHIAEHMGKIAPTWIGPRLDLINRHTRKAWTLNAQSRELLICEVRENRDRDETLLTGKIAQHPLDLFIREFDDLRDPLQQRWHIIDILARRIDVPGCTVRRQRFPEPVVNQPSA